MDVAPLMDVTLLIEVPKVQVRDVLTLFKWLESLLKMNVATKL